ncbi:biotin/lipoyl-binding protein [Priestia filamentosa]|uniref:HlyD family efflux transporter periplasmic adaptor subunit n=1 Tax=Priestia filamentosa TaxID=1402861 RepID=UPI0039819EE4
MFQKVRDIRELTDSIEMMEKNPPSFIKIFLSILILIITLSLIWAYSSEIDITIDSTASIEPKVSTVSIKPDISGTVTDVSIQSGKEVKKGEILVSINNPELEQENKYIQEKQRKLRNKLVDLKNLKEAIQDKDSNLISEAESLIHVEYKNYINKITIMGIENEENKEIYSNKLETINKSKDEIILGLESDIKSLKYELGSLNKNLDKMNKADKSLVEEEIQNTNSLIDMKEKQIENRNEILNSEKSSIKSSIERQEDKFLNELEEAKSSKLLDIESRIEEIQVNLQELNKSLDKLGISEEKKVIKAPYNGIVEMPKEINKGDKVESNQTLFSLAPVKTENKILLYINANDVNSVSVNDKVQYTFNTREKSYHGKIVQIYKDSITNKKDGKTYFMAEGSINSDTPEKLYSGSLGQAVIIVDHKKPLSIFLEKLSFI